MNTDKYDIMNQIPHPIRPTNNPIKIKNRLMTNTRNSTFALDKKRPTRPSKSATGDS